jgi:hypothetical protein
MISRSAGHDCPVCRSIHTQRASQVAEERIRNAIAEHWAQAPGARGPDGKWLRSGVLVWAGALVLASLGSGLDWLAPWQWAAVLAAVAGIGMQSDRHTARRRGWVDPMQRAHDIVQHARERDATLDDCHSTATGVPDYQLAEGPEFICLRCGHRFEPAPVEALTA